MKRSFPLGCPKSIFSVSTLFLIFFCQAISFIDGFVGLFDFIPLVYNEIEKPLSIYGLRV